METATHVNRGHGSSFVMLFHFLAVRALYKPPAQIESTFQLETRRRFGFLSNSYIRQGTE
jgi:hypothetical protein